MCIRDRCRELHYIVLSPVQNHSITLYLKKSEKQTVLYFFYKIKRVESVLQITTIVLPDNFTVVLRILEGTCIGPHKKTIVMERFIRSTVTCYIEINGGARIFCHSRMDVIRKVLRRICESGMWRWRKKK